MKPKWLLLMAQDLLLTSAGESTNDIAHLLGMLDPWYERNTLSLLDLPTNIVCKVHVDFDTRGFFLSFYYYFNALPLVSAHIRSPCFALQQTSKTESESYDDSYEQRLPILADLVLYYCRHAAGPALIQLYQAEVRLISAFFFCPFGS